MVKVGLVVAILLSFSAPLLVRLGVPYKIGLASCALAVIASAALGMWLLKSSLIGLTGLIPLLVAAPFVYRGITAPPVADVMTRIEPPIEFLQAPPTENPLTPSPEVIQAHQGAYADLRTQTVQNQPAQAILRYAQDNGWQITERNEAGIQMTATSRLFGFSDDIVVIWQSDGQGFIVDARSKSRVGVSDLGANAQRLRALLRSLD